MNLVQLLSAEAGPERRRILVAATISGAANAVILNSINKMAKVPADNDVRALFIYALLVVLYVSSAKHTNRAITRLIEAVLHRIKVRVGDKLAHAELEALERVKAAEICDRITENTTFISDRAGAIAAALQSAVVLVFATFYLAWFAMPAFVIVGLVGVVGMFVFLDVRRQFVMHVRQTLKGRVTFLDRMTDLLAGFKEMQFGRRRRREVREHVVEAADAVRKSSVQSSNLMSDGVVLGNAILFVMLTSIVYTLHIYVPMDGMTLTSIVAAVMFLWGPFMSVMMGTMPVIRANLALDEIAALEEKLATAVRIGQPTVRAEDPWRGSLGKIEGRDIEYEYPTDDGAETFRIGPLNFDINAGEVLFIVGGNGSGKSTFLKVLTGLYAPTTGSLVVNGVAVARNNVEAYRDMISAIFTDFHLFAKLYGLAGIDEESVNRLIVRMRLEGKTAFVNRAFTKLTLSTGQRKRIAMIVTMLEKRQVCIFDEWAADQDPEFRQYFYYELIPMLRNEGKTIIVVSHDDRYFHCADRVVTMEYGKIRSIERPATMTVAT
ncbi:MAG TPA: cyclic peptide export ABC transporter [Polyangium sp.]|nr:cyclic peptide export ABC transporter [Polyangium sp.]